jgi:hypothetical protein
MAAGKLARGWRRNRAALPKTRRRMFELLEGRTLLAAGEWLVKLDHVPGNTRGDQLWYIQGLFHKAGLDADGIVAREHAGVDGVVIVQTDPDATEEAVKSQLQVLPDFKSIEPWDDADPPADRGIYVPDSPFEEFAESSESKDADVAAGLALQAGDLNFDGSVDIADLQPLMTVLRDLGGFAAEKNLTDDQLRAVADMNKDGRVDNADVIGLVTVIATKNASSDISAGDDGDKGGGVVGPAVVTSLSGFDGINSTQTSILSPPDSDGAVGPNSFIEAVNVSLAIYNKTTGGTLPGGSITPFSTFFSSLGTSGVTFSDPIVVYNDVTQRFAVGILDFHVVNNAVTDSRLDFAISKTSNPTLSASDWNFFRYNTNDGVGASLDFSDYPKIGYNADGYVVSFNMFPSGFDHVSVLGIANNGTSTGMRVMPGGFTNFTLAPASEHSAAPGAPMWFVGDGHSGGGGSTINVVRLDNPFSPAAVVSTSFSINVASYLSAPNSRQPGGSLGDSTTLGTRFYFSGLRTVGGVTYLASAHAVGNGTGVEARFYEFNVTSGTPALLQQGTVNPNPATTDTYFPEMDIAPDGTLGMNYSESGTSEYMSMYFTGQRPAVDALGTMETPKLAKTNPVVLNAFGRAGDYSFTSVDPADGSFWAVNEYAGSFASPNWATWIQHFTLGALVVANTTPAANSIVSTPPTTFAITFSDPIDAATLDAGDLTVNSIPADAVALSADGKTATFTYNTSPVNAQGQQSMALAAGAVTKLGDPTTTLFAYGANFRYDVVILQVTSTSPSASSVFTLPGPFTLDVNFNESVDPASVTAGSLGLVGISGAAVTGAVVLPGNMTARFTLSGITAEGTLTASIAAAGVTDAFGNPIVPFLANFIVDVATTPFPVPLNPVAPAGSLIYDPTASGIIGTAGDSDTFTLPVDPGQSITVLVTPTTSGLRPSVALLDPFSGTLAIATAGAAGQNALIQSVPATAPGGGNYRIVVSGSGGTTGGYTVQVILNAMLENEGNLVGASDNSVANAQLIDSSFIRLSSGSTPSRGAILGQTDNATFTATAVGFSFENIASSGTTITGLTGQDEASVSIPIGFNFPFFGTTNTSVFVSSNGLLTFGAANTAFLNADLTSDPTQAAIAPFWDDLLVSGGANSTVRYQVLGSGTNQHLTIQWNQVSFFSGGTSGDTLTFEAQLYVDGRIQFNYLDLTSGTASGNNGASATAGIKAAGTQGTNRLLLAFNNGPNSFVGASKSTLLTPPAGTADYYRVSLSAGDKVTIAVASLGSGNVSIDLRDTSNGLLATGVAGPTNLSKIISNYAAPAPTSYYVRVTGDLNIPYSLVITRNAGFDTEANDSFAAAQSIDNSGAGALGSISSLTGSSTTINFTELSARPADGVSINGVTFGFTIGGISSTDATFGGAGPGATLYTTPPQLEGNAAGVLSMSFATPTLTLSFPVVLSTTGTVVNAATIQLFDAANNLISTTSLTTSVPPGFSFTEGLFTYGGLTPVKQAKVSFNSAAGRFVLDNIAFGTAVTPDNDWYSLTVAAGSAIGLATTTPADGSGEFVNTLAPKIEVYNPLGVLAASGTVGPDGRNETLAYIAPSAGVYRIHVSGKNSTRGEYFLNSQVTPLSTVQTVTIDDGTAQRSRVRSITLVFNGVITAAPSSAFQITRTEDGAIIPVIASSLTPLSGGRTQVTLTFDGTLDAGSLADGRYTLVIDGSQIVDSFGRQLDAGGTGTAGSAKNVSFFRFFSDSNGDGHVDAADFTAFASAYQSENALGANSIYDVDGDGAFTQADLDAFTKNFTIRVLN